MYWLERQKALESQGLFFVMYNAEKFQEHFALKKIQTYYCLKTHIALIMPQLENISAVVFLKCLLLFVTCTNIVMFCLFFRALTHQTELIHQLRLPHVFCLWLHMNTLQKKFS